MDFIFEEDADEVGGEIEAFCPSPRCKADTTHTIISMYEDEVRRVTHQRAEIGIMILEEFRGKGLASEALDLLINYAFSPLQMHQVFCNIGPDNSESIRLFESKGFRLVGIKKDWNRIRNIWQDECLYQLINQTVNS